MVYGNQLMLPLSANSSEYARMWGVNCLTESKII